MRGGFAIAPLILGHPYMVPTREPLRPVDIV